MNIEHTWTESIPGLPVRQRDRFAAWLRERGMVRYDSHQVARDPAARWWIIHGSDGWVRAVPVYSKGYSPLGWMTVKLGRAGIVIVETYIMRFRRVPCAS